MLLITAIEMLMYTTPSFWIGISEEHYEVIVLVFAVIIIFESWKYYNGTGPKSTRFSYSVQLGNQST